jgi:ribonuclease HIII
MPNNYLSEKNPENATSHVCEINNEQRLKLEAILKDRGAAFAESPYSFWKVIFKKMNITAYKSGKLVIQGAGTGEFVLFTLEPEITGEAVLGYQQNPQKEDEDAQEPFAPHAGIDESGKGDLFGSLVISAVFVDEASAERLKKIGVRDSKTIKNDAKIAYMAEEIRKSVNGLFSTVSIGPQAYNRIYEKFNNLNKLLAWGHARALENLLEKKQDIPFALSDKFGAEHLILNALLEKGKKIRLVQKTKAESDIAVAAASILARDTFVSKMRKLSEESGFNLPKGAGTQAKEALRKIFENKGKEVLPTVAKMHFKTVREVLGPHCEEPQISNSEDLPSARNPEE